MASYAELLGKAQPQIITDGGCHQCALRTVELLMKKPRLTKAEGKLLDLLAKLIDDYEESLYPMPEVSPNLMLEHFIEARGTTQAELARQTGVPRSTISQPLKGKGAISVENASGLPSIFTRIRRCS